MQTVTRLGLALVLAAAFVYAETWTGKLYDADCLSRDAMAACTPTTSTTSFKLEVSGKKYMLDEEGNKKAAEAFRKSESGADRAADPEEEHDTGITATVTGTLHGERIDVDSITVH